MTSILRIYRVLLHCYPAAFKEEYGGQMVLMFAEQMDEAQRTGNRLGQAALWAQAAADACTIAPKEHLHVILQDLRYALRVVAAKPSFAAVAILSLALGIGANTAIFSLWNGILRSSLPAVSKPEELAILSNPGTEGLWHGSVSGDRDWLSYPEFEDLRDHAQSFTGLMASQSGLATWPVRLPGSEWEKAHTRLVSGGFFDVLGVHPAMGRLFTAAEDDRAALPHTVISYNYWQSHFGGRPDVLGKTISLTQTTLTIMGVAPRGFIGETAGQQPDFWIPLLMQRAVVPSEDVLHEKPPTKIMFLHVFGRLKPGVTLQRADAEANRIFKIGLQSFYGSVASAQRRRELLDQRLKLRSGARGASETRNNFSTSLTALFVAVGLLLLIACANLANLLLARGAARKPEMALRLSLGASRGRLIRQLLTESLLLSSLGSVSGLAVAYLLHGVLVRKIIQSDRNFSIHFSLDPLVLFFTLGITLAAALLFGLLPAWQATKTDAVAGLKEQSRSASSGIGRMRLGRSLVSLQLALSVPLLIGAGLLARTFYNLQHQDLGYPAGHLLLIDADFRKTVQDNARRGAVLRELVAQFQRIPGVRAASFSQVGVFSGGNSTARVDVEGYVAKNESDHESSTDSVEPGYFSALGVPLILGREISERDDAGAPKVCVINQAFAERFFAGRNPIGMRISLRGTNTGGPTYQVIGVAKNARTQTLRGEVETRFFVAMKQDFSAANYPKFLIRTTTETGPMLAAVRQVFRTVAPTLSIDSLGSLEEQMAPLIAQDRTMAQLAVVFGLVALALAAIGLYGVLSYSVARRTGEIAVRIALGAQPGRVISMILRETGELIIIGLAVGAALAYAASRLINSRLFGIAPQDPLTTLLATMLLLLVAFSAAYLPARRASKLDPMAALRQE